MSLQNSLPAPRGAGTERYWAPCLAVALVAVSLFYATLKDLVQESAARAPTLATAVMPAHVEPTRPSDNRLLPDVPDATARSSMESRMPAPRPAPAIVTAAPPAKAVPAFVEVHKCVMPEGDAAYSDGPCPEGASASTLRLPRDPHASTNL
ncbi:hypothetical protein VAPA_1c34420 [Variovorax paradoxus B4]|uniref:Uncharacterized protein n=2 Tax=Variovorax paradoxus TaxID=34073 RepID=A0A0H2M7I5_VARPD|nr:hypothetical protein [Variovorax paradoxus]AGU50528.1 hypothetical protein VAPA_1c34420 [Variovorax paradoxus B4]KLN53010.1 hypothetical protein VPARA_58720 [Variovorax paradoxus]